MGRREFFGLVGGATIILPVPEALLPPMQVQSRKQRTFPALTAGPNWWVICLLRGPQARIPQS